MIKHLIKRLVPRGSKRFNFLKQTAAIAGFTSPIGFSPDYQRWIKYVEPERYLPIVSYGSDKPLFSIVIPFYNTPDRYLYPLLDSIRGQSFQAWELVMADASTDKERAITIKAAGERDERFKYYRVKNNEGISANTNFALKRATAEYVVFCDHDDILSPHALNEMAARILADDSIDILYSDEDKLADNGKLRHSPFFKPDWSPHLFLNTNYTNHLSVVRRKLVEGVGGLRPDFDGSQDYDLLLRIHRKFGPLNVTHIDKILYHWREAAGSTAVNHNSKSYAFEAGRKALQEYIDAGGVEGVVTNIPQRPGFYNHKFTPSKLKTATIYVAVSDDEDANRRFMDRLVYSTDDTVVKATFVPVTRTALSELLKTVAKTDAVFIFRSTALPCEPDWLTRLCGVLELDDVKKVAPRILNADMGRISDMGLVDDGDGVMVPLMKNLSANDQTFVGHAEWVRDVDELSGAVEGYSTKLKKTDGHNVIWSYVNFKNQHMLRSSRFLSGNVFISPKNGKVRINGKL